jgi:hypothetical protein
MVVNSFRISFPCDEISAQSAPQLASVPGSARLSGLFGGLTKNYGPRVEMDGVGHAAAAEIFFFAPKSELERQP